MELEAKSIILDAEEYYDLRHNARRWVSVKEMLPCRDGKVLAYYHFRKNEMCFIGVLDYYAYDEHPHFQHEGTGIVVTHWMMLPDPPKGEDEE